MTRPEPTPGRARHAPALITAVLALYGVKSAAAIAEEMGVRFGASLTRSAVIGIAKRARNAGAHVGPSAAPATRKRAHAASDAARQEYERVKDVLLAGYGKERAADMADKVGLTPLRVRRVLAGMIAAGELQRMSKEQHRALQSVGTRLTQKPRVTGPRSRTAPKAAERPEPAQRAAVVTLAKASPVGASASPFPVLEDLIGAPLAVNQAKRCACRWPLGHPREAGFRFCDAVVERPIMVGPNGQERANPYCEEHREQARAPREVKAMRLPSPAAMGYGARPVRAEQDGRAA